MIDRKEFGISVVAGAVGLLAGMAIGVAQPALAQRIEAAYSAGTFQISAGNQNEAWRVNTSTGETFHCVGGQSLTCRRAEVK